MLKRSCQPLALAVLVAMSAPAGAVAVNDMAVWSEAGAPLRMDIELADVNPARLGDASVRVASAEDHERLGVTRPGWADQVRFKLIKTASGKLVARATTSAAVPGDYVSFLVYIRADGQSRLQQVAGTGQAEAGGQAQAQGRGSPGGCRRADPGPRAGRRACSRRSCSRSRSCPCSDGGCRGRSACRRGDACAGR